MKSVTDRELTAWRDVLRMLREAGAVTDADLASSVKLNDTAGQRLLNQIRAWGDLRAELVSVAKGRGR